MGNSFVPGENALPYMIAGRAVMVETTEEGFRATCSDAEVVVHRHVLYWPDEPYRVELFYKPKDGAIGHYSGFGYSEPLTLEQFLEAVERMLRALERERAV